jgi:hypothetical protein
VMKPKRAVELVAQFSFSFILIVLDIRSQARTPLRKETHKV